MRRDPNPGLPPPTSGEVSRRRSSCRLARSSPRPGGKKSWITTRLSTGASYVRPRSCSMANATTFLRRGKARAASAARWRKPAIAITRSCFFPWPTMVCGLFASVLSRTTRRFRATRLNTSQSCSRGCGNEGFSGRDFNDRIEKDSHTALHSPRHIWYQGQNYQRVLEKFTEGKTFLTCQFLLAIVALFHDGSSRIMESNTRANIPV